MALIFHPDRKSFVLLNFTQFLGALNDNVFKLLIAFLLINLLGPQQSPVILSITGAVFVIPFLVFSNAAGVLADRHSKRHIIVGAKFAEFIIMLLSVIAIYYRSIFFAYFFIFCMGSQSALFGPSKYGIIPELVDPKKISKANGIINSFTYLAIIFGTFLAPFITDVTNKHFVKASMLCVGISFLGFLTSMGIKKTPPKKGKKRINPFFIYEIYQTLALTAKRPHLFWAVFGSSFFLFLGGFAQLNLIPFAIQSLHLSEVGGGYLFLPLAIGIAIGSLISGKLTKETIEIGLSCLSGYLLALFFLLLWIFSHFLIPTVIILSLLGMVGGIFIIPFDSFIQLRSPQGKRGQIIAASNFLSFFGVLLAAILLYLFSEVFTLAASTGFLLFSVLTLFYNTLVTGKLADLFFPYFAKKILRKIYKTQFPQEPPEASSLFILPKGSWKQALLLFCIYPALRIYKTGTILSNFPYFNGLFNNIFITPKYRDTDYLIFRINKYHQPNAPMLLFSDEKFDQEVLKENFKKVYTISIKEEFQKKRIGFLIYKKKAFTFSFRE